MRSWGSYAHQRQLYLCSCDNELNIETKLPAEPDYLDVFVWLFAVGNEDDTLFGVSLNPFTAQLIEQVGTAFGESHKQDSD